MIKNNKKHISVPIREWTNNHYSFNKNLEKHSLPYLNTSNKIIKNYFNLTPKEISFKSKRMRDLIKKSSTTRIFNSRGEVKQYGDKVNITIYTFDKERLFLLKSLYSFNKAIAKFKKLNKITFRKLVPALNKINNTNKLKNIVISKYPSFSNLNDKSVSSALNYINKSVPSASNKLFKLTKTNNKHYLNIFDKNMNYYYKKLVPSFNKKISTRKVNVRIPLRRSSFFKKKRLMLQSKKSLLYKKFINNLPWSYNSNRGLITKITIMRLFYLFVLKNSNLTYYLNKQENSVYLYKQNNGKHLNVVAGASAIKIKLPAKYIYLLNEQKKKNKTSNAFGIRMNYLKWERSIYINKILNKVIIKLLAKWFESKQTNNNLIAAKGVNVLYKEFIANNIGKLLNHYYVKQYQLINNIYKSFITNDKFTHLTNNLKFLLNKIYSKKVNLNITNLKYSHLNADIFTNVLVTKLIHKKSNIERIITKGFKLVKLAKINKLTNDSVPSASKNVSLGDDESKKRTINLYNLINEMYNNSFNSSLITSKWNSSLHDSKSKEIINNLKHKWTTGIKIEGKGRLTSRYAAARAIHKYRAKGNLRSKLPLTTENILKLGKKRNRINKSSPSNILFRGINTPNIQYVKKSGFKRIGSFGIKVWINNN